MMEGKLWSARVERKIIEGKWPEANGGWQIISLDEGSWLWVNTIGREPAWNVESVDYLSKQERTEELESQLIETLEYQDGFS